MELLTKNGGRKNMTISSILKAKHIGVKSFRTHLSKFIRSREPYIVTDRGEPQEVLIPYDDLIELVEDLEELSDPKLIKQIAEGREAYKKGGWTPVSRLWRKLGVGK